MERNKYANVIMTKMLNNCKYIPIRNKSEWYISPMPATESGTTMWQYVKFLKKMGAKMVFGVVCVKSLKDSDNI